MRIAMTVSTTDEVVLPSARPTRRWRFGRFSLLSFLLAVSLIRLGLELQTRPRYQLLKKEERRADDRNQYLVVHLSDKD